MTTTQILRAGIDNRSYTETPEVVERNMRVIVRMVFYFACLGAFIDALTTWLVIKKYGVRVEGNGLMAYGMRHIGVNEVLGLRILIGVCAFWLFTNYLIGNHYFYTKWGRRRYVNRIKRSEERAELSVGGFRRGYWTTSSFIHQYALVFSVMLGLLITWGVDGNNIRVVLETYH
jgi:hypothetical protein